MSLGINDIPIWATAVATSTVPLRYLFRYLYRKWRRRRTVKQKEILRELSARHPKPSIEYGAVLLLFTPSEKPKRGLEWDKQRKYLRASFDYTGAITGLCDVHNILKPNGPQHRDSYGGYFGAYSFTPEHVAQCFEEAG